MRSKLAIESKILTAFCIILILGLPVLSIRSVFAATIFEDGFESGDFSAWTTKYQSGATISVTSGDAHHGTYKAAVTGLKNAGGYAYESKTLPSTYKDLYARAYVQINSTPTTTAWYDMGVDIDGTSGLIAKAIFNQSATKWGIRVYTSGSYRTYYESGTSIVNSGVYYCVELRTYVDSSGFITLWVDGTMKLNQTGFNTSSHGQAAYAFAGFRWVEAALGSTLTEYVDCFVVDTAYIGPECNLTVNVVGSGSVAKDPDQTVYDWGTNVTLTATPTTGWSFDQWSGDASGTDNPITINMTSDKTVTVTFTQNTYTLTVNTIGSGLVNLNNTGPYHYGDVVELTAVPSAGWSFDSWSGDLSGSVNPDTILIDGDKTVTANFTQNEYALTVTTVGSGSVDLNATGPYHYGDVVELTAVPDIHWSFDHWSGDLSGSSNPTTLVMTGDLSVTAHFSVIHDVAITNVMRYKTVIFQGFTSNFTVTVENHGGSSETFDVTLYSNLTATGNMTMIAKTTVTLLNGASTLLNFTWNTAGFAKGNYTIIAAADIVPGETDIGDNRFTDGWIIVAMIGDITGPKGWPDGKCDIMDIALVAKNFGQNVPPAPANCDVTGPTTGVPDGKIDIRDIALVAKNFGKVDP